MSRILLLPLYLLILFPTNLFGQTLSRFSPRSGNLQGYRVADVFPQDAEKVWLRQDMPATQVMLFRDTARYFSTLQTGLNPYSNPLIGAFPSFNNTTWMAFNRLPGYVEGPFGNCNGGLARYQNNQFTLFNSQNFPPLSQLKEKLWYSAVLSPDGQHFWVGGDSGIRSIDLGTFQVRSYFNDSTFRNLAYWRRGLASKTGVWFHRDTYQWVYEKDNELLPFVNLQAGLDDSLLLVDVAFMQADTFFLTRARYTTGKAFLFKRNQTTQIVSLPGNPVDLMHLAVERDSALWILGKSGLFRLKDGSGTNFSQFLPPSNAFSCLRTDPAGNKWIGTLDSGLYKLNNLKIQIQIAGGKKQPYCYSAPVAFASQVSSIGGQQFQYKWHFGDGSTSTEANPTHLYAWTGRFKIRLTVTDQFGAILSVSDTLELDFKQNIYMLPNKDTVSFCQSVNLENTSRKKVKWQLPDGTTRVDSLLNVNTPGIYSFQMEEPGCKTSDTIVVIRTPDQVSTIQLSTLSDSLIQEGDTLVSYLPLTLKAKEVNGYCSPLWLVNSANYGVKVEQDIQFEQEGEYLIKVSSSSFENCKSSAERTFYLKKKTIPVTPEPPPLFIPNLVTQNKDGVNEQFRINPTGKTIAVQIFNRWGKKVFSSDNYVEEWPDSDLPAGVYFYTLKHGDQFFQGWIELLK